MSTKSRQKQAGKKGAPALAPAASAWSAWASGRDWIRDVLLFVGVFLAYLPVWRAGYIWDDDLVVTANPVVVGPAGLKEIWTTSAADICPVTLSTFWLEHALWGIAPLPYHLVNLALHAGCAMILWRVLRGLEIPGAWLGAAVWALHPVEVASVAWISEMKNTESCVFYLLSALFFIKWLKRGATEKAAGIDWPYLWSLLFAALAMASKSSTVILPLVLCLCARWMQGRWVGSVLLRTAPIFVMSLLAGLVSLWTQSAHGFEGQPALQSWPQRLVIAGDAVWFYLGKLLWPHPLIMVYPRWNVDALNALSYLPLVLVLLTLGTLWTMRGTWARGVFFAFAYFVVALLPVLGLLNMNFFRYSFVSDHFQYLASMGPLALIASGLFQLGNFLARERTGAPITLFGGVLGLLAIVSWNQAATFADEKTLWNHALAWNPDCWEGHNNLGYALLGENKVDEASAEFQKAVALNPDFPEAHYNYGNAVLAQGHAAQAETEYREALRLRPRYLEAHYKLGIALSRQSQVDAAMAEYLQALALNPNFAEAHCSLGIAYLGRKEFGPAIAEFEKSLALNPRYSLACVNLGIAYAISGKIELAIAQFRKATEINPSSADFHYNLGNALLEAGQVEESITEFHRVLEINPSSAEAYCKLGIALEEKGLLNQAIPQFQQALQLKPGLALAQTHLAKIQSASAPMPASP